MLEEFSYALSGCIFGLAGGFTPGPTTALVVAQTVRFGVAEGVKVAVAPLLTDAPIIIIAVLIVGQISRFSSAIGVITLLGAAFLIYLAVETFLVRGVEIDERRAAPRSIRRGFAVNLLNPHPYLFWVMVGAPTLLKAADAGWFDAVAFITGFYLCLIGSKVLVACLVGRARGFLKSRSYIFVNRVLGLALAAFAVLFLRDAWHFLAVGWRP